MKKRYSRICWDNYPENKTPIGNPKQCGIFEIQNDRTLKTLFLSDSNGVHVDLLEIMR